MFSHFDTESLNKATNLQKQCFELQLLFSRISEKEKALKTTETEIIILRAQIEATESSKRDFKEKWVTLTNQQKQLCGIIDNAFKQINKKQDALQQARKNLDELQSMLIRIAADTSKLTAEKNNLERKYASSVKREFETNERLLSIQIDYDNFKIDKEMDLIKCEEQIKSLINDRTSSYDQSSTFLLQLTRSRQSERDLKMEYREVVEKRDQLALNLKSTSEAYRKFKTLYEENIARDNHNMSKLKSELTSVTAEKEKVLSKCNSLERSLEEERELFIAQLRQLKHKELKCKEILTKFETYRAKETIKNNKLKERREQYEKEFQEYQRKNYSLQECINSRDLELSNTKSELIDFTRRADTLYDENVSLRNQLKSVTDAYNATKETMDTQSIKHRMGVFNGTIENDKQYEHTIENWNCNLQDTSEFLSMVEKELDDDESIDQQDIKDNYSKSVIEIDLENQVSDVNQEIVLAKERAEMATQNQEVINEKETQKRRRSMSD